MKLHTAVFVAFAGIAALACGGAGSVSQSSIPSVSLTPPWDSMNLPIGDGSVMASSDSNISVTYTSGSLHDITGKYDEAVKAAGWSETFKSDQPGAYAVAYSKDGATLNLGGAEAGGYVTISISKI